MAAVRACERRRVESSVRRARCRDAPALPARACGCRQPNPGPGPRALQAPGRRRLAPSFGRPTSTRASSPFAQELSRTLRSHCAADPARPRTRTPARVVAPASPGTRLLGSLGPQRKPLLRLARRRRALSAMGDGATCEPASHRALLSVTGLLRGFSVSTFDLVLTASAYARSPGALLALRLVQARVGAGTLASTSPPVARLPLELWAAIENAVIDTGWSAAQRKHCKMLKLAKCCGCPRPCGFVTLGINARSLAAAEPDCLDNLEQKWRTVHLDLRKHVKVSAQSGASAHPPGRRVFPRRSRSQICRTAT